MPDQGVWVSSLCLALGTWSHSLSFPPGLYMALKSLRSLIMCLLRTGRCSISMDDCSPSRSVPPFPGALGPFSTVEQSLGGFCPGRGGAALCPPHSEPCVPCPDHPEPPGGGTPAGLDQLLPPLHGPAQTAQEAVRSHPACVLLLLGLSEERGRSLRWALTCLWVASCAP